VLGEGLDGPRPARCRLGFQNVAIGASGHDFTGQFFRSCMVRISPSVSGSSLANLTRGFAAFQLGHR